MIACFLGFVLNDIMIAKMMSRSAWPAWHQKWDQRFLGRRSLICILNGCFVNILNYRAPLAIHTHSNRSPGPASCARCCGTARAGAATSTSSPAARRGTRSGSAVPPVC